MSGTELIGSHCPYCGEPIQLIVDCSVAEQEYIEDCQVCCRPILIRIYEDLDGSRTISVQTEDD